ncbi:T9SS type A sorting domain-containing protein [Hymenobacter sp. HSC-4F20]|uniref:CARDB domain-containing protein n=1 Tax=Hymenobacter sp. HSC-4F20 TaxID=2864135 RepID=UPI001C72F0E8|nr:CARDB domain-containing protein [Hymenobacter sp. HSC-4F20]MBX0291189.1 T9SS type A sorting domain-containing protein [Hymenobacter sp. HSC-4F20]
MQQLYSFFRQRLRCRPGALLTLILLWWTQAAAAQTYIMPANGAATFTTCSGTLYDDGGANGAYSAYANGTVTLTPGIAGNKIQLSFSYLSLETSYDRLTIYDGPTTASPVIGTYDYNPGTVYATSSNGSLTVRFTSDGSGQYSGFAADVSCVTSVPQADLAVQSASVQPLAAVAGGNLQLSCAVYNLAAAVASSSTVGYYLSTNATLDAADLLLTSSPGGQLGASQSGYRAASATLPSTTAPGTYYVLFVADYQNTVSETNEANNLAAVSLNILPPSIDLLIQQPSVGTTTTTPSSVLRLSCSIRNQGNSTALNSSVGFYLSSNSTLDASDQLLTSAFGGQLTAGYSDYRSISTNLPANTNPGNYYILFVADYQSIVAESNETNNVTAVALSVVPPSLDLTVSQAQLSQTTALAGSFINYSSYVYNQGNTAAPVSGQGVYLSTDATFSANDVQLTTNQIPSLNEAQSYYTYGSFTLPSPLTSGTYYVLFVADYQNTVSETNEANNVRAVALQVVLPTIDLSIQQPYLNVSSAATGNTFTASSYISNTGNAPAASSTVGYYLSTNTVLDASDVLLGNSPGGNLSGTTSGSRYASLTVPNGTAVGTYYVLFAADYLDQVSETNETNNVASVQLRVVQAGVDLVVSQNSLSRLVAAPNSSLSAYSNITNQGTTAAASSSVGFYLSTDATLSTNDVLLGSSIGGYLSANDYGNRSALITVPSATTAGTYYVLFVADHQNAVAETNETNNVAATTLTVTAPFNGILVPQSGSNTVTTCSGTVYDNGGTGNYADYSNGTLTINPGTVGGRVQLAFSYLNVETCCDRLIIYDGPNTSSPVLGYYNSYPGTVIASNTAINPTGALTLSFYSDGSYTTDGFEAAISCVGGTTGPVDLVPSQPSATPTAATAGGTVVLSTLVSNTGTGTAGSSAVGYYLSTDNAFSSNDVSLGSTGGVAISGGQSATRGLSATIPANTAVGQYYVLHVVDPQNAVAETNETNNVTSSVLSIGSPRPDLTILQPALQASSIVAGNNLGVSCLLANQGSAAAAASTTGYYLSSDNVLSSNDLLLGTAAAGTMAAGSATPSLALVLIPGTVPAGNYQVLFVADHAAAVTEAVETNNVASVALSVTVVQGNRDEQLQGFTLQVYPNPVGAEAQLRVKLTGAPNGKTAQATLVNSVGQEVARRDVTLSGSLAPVTFDTRSLSRGVYLLRISGAGLHATRRVVIE